MTWLSIALIFLNTFAWAQVLPAPLICPQDNTYVHHPVLMDNLSQIEQIADFLQKHTDEEDLTNEKILLFQNEMKNLAEQWRSIEVSMDAKIKELEKLDKSFDGRFKTLEIMAIEQEKYIEKLKLKKAEAQKKYKAFSDKYKGQLADAKFTQWLEHDPQPVWKAAATDVVSYNKKYEEAEDKFSNLRMSVFGKNKNRPN